MGTRSAYGEYLFARLHQQKLLLADLDAQHPSFRNRRDWADIPVSVCPLPRFILR
jgi:hypothetical protein